MNLYFNYDFVPIMPYHSSKNFYKAEQELSDALEKEDYTKLHELCSSFCEYSDSAFNTECVETIRGGSIQIPLRCSCCFDLDCKFVGCNCNYCYELNRWNSKAILEKYFTAEQILAYNSSLPLTNITRFYCESCKKINRNVYGVYNNGLGNVCMNRIYIGREDYYYEYEYCLKKMVPCGEELIVKKKELYKYILSDKYCLQPIEPEKLNMEMISDKTLDYFINIHRQNVFEYHEQTYDREAGELLKKYGLTLVEYKKRKCVVKSV